MITNEDQDVFQIWMELSDKERLSVITKFKLQSTDPTEILSQNDIKNYLKSHYIYRNRKQVITK